MNCYPRVYIILSMLACLYAGQHVAAETFFTYSGRLSSASENANGLYDFQFTLFQTPQSGTPIAYCQVSNVRAAQGQFTAELRFTNSISASGELWLSTGVRTNGSTAPYANLEPRQNIGIVPRAALARKAEEAANLTGGGSNLTNISGAAITSGTITERHFAPGALAGLPVATSTNSGLLGSNMIAQINIAPSLFANVAPVPPMGWNSWAALYTANLSERVIVEMADFISTNGLREIGYEYVNLDDGWAGFRKPDGNLEADPERFPHGIEWLIRYVHSRGLKIGLYFVMGLETNLGNPGSHGHWEQDATYFANLGVDFVKLSFDSGWETWPEVYKLYQRFIAAWQSTGRPAFINASVHHFEPWMARGLNSWHMVCEGDATGSFYNLLMRLDCCSPTAFAVSKGHWLDMDFISARTPTLQSYKVEFGMHALLAGQILVPGFPPEMMSVLTNTEVIAVLKDPAGIPAHVASRAPDGSWEAWVRPLSDSNSKAVGILNRHYAPVRARVRWADIGLPPGVATVRDLWSHSTVAFARDSFELTVPPLSLALFKISPGAPSPFHPGQNFLSEQQWLPGMVNGLGTDYIQYFPPTRDRNFDGSPLAIKSRTYARGLALTADGQIEFFLGGMAKAFYAELGLDTHFPGDFEAKVVISADGTPVFGETLRFGDEPLPIRIPVAGAQVLRIATLSLKPASRLQHVTLGNARVVAEEPKADAASERLSRRLGDFGSCFSFPLTSAFVQSSATNGSVTWSGPRSARLSIMPAVQASAGFRAVASIDGAPGLAPDGSPSDKLNWSRPFAFSCSFSWDAANAAPGSLLRIWIGANREHQAFAPEESGIGFEVGPGSRVFLLARSGAILKREDSGAAIAGAGLVKHTVAVSSCGDGELSLYVDGELVGSWLGGPTSIGKPSHDAATCELLGTKITANAQCVIHALTAAWD